MDYGYSFEPPRRGGSNEYPQSMFGVKLFYLKIFIFFFLVVKFSVYIWIGVFS